jgi:hypothetical protein
MRSICGAFVLLLSVVYVAFAYPTPELDELFALDKFTKCQRTLNDGCVRGTVEVDPWLASTLATQRDLQANMTLDKVTFLGTHNSFNSRSEGPYGVDDDLLRDLLHMIGIKDDDINIAQQGLAFVDQLNIGVRHLMLDPQWAFDKVRLCHAGTDFPRIDKIIAFVEKELHIKLNFSSEQVGCAPWDKPIGEGFAEIGAWVEAHPGEVIQIEINSSPGWDWGHIAEVMDPLKQYMGDYIFTPHMAPSFDKFTPNDVRAAGKRVVVLGDGSYSTYGGDYIFLSPYVGYPENDANKYHESLCDTYANSYSCFSGESQILGFLYNGEADMGLITGPLLTNMTRCGVRLPKFDQVSPALLEYAVFTWARAEPSLPIADPSVLVVLDHSTERWRTVHDTDLTTKLYACRLASGWALTSTVAACQSGGGIWDTPRNGYDQQKLLTAMGSDSATVILSYPSV